MVNMESFSEVEKLPAHQGMGINRNKVVRADVHGDRQPNKVRAERKFRTGCKLKESKRLGSLSLEGVSLPPEETLKEGVGVFPFPGGEPIVLND